MQENPSRILKHAMQHLVNTRNLRQERSAMAAYFILVKAQAEVFFNPPSESNPGCIDELIGPRMRELGIRCPCPKHRGLDLEAEDLRESLGGKAQPRATQPSQRDAKMAAAGDKNNSE